MNEQEWLTCDDPWKMLGSCKAWGWITPAYKPSDRKFRLFACACCWRHFDDLGEDAEQIAEAASGVASDALKWAQGWAGDQTIPGMPERAAILRDLVGNPFRKPTLCGKPHQPGLGAEGHCDYWCGDCAAVRNPTVVALAQAAYEERGRKCDRCNATGSDLVECKCPDCHGTGTINDGTLDNDRLAVLSDALEESGCDNAELLMHLRGKERCPQCLDHLGYEPSECKVCSARPNEEGEINHGKGCYMLEDDGGGTELADPCNRCGAKGLIPKRSPCYRGCAILDLILGKE